MKEKHPWRLWRRSRAEEDKSRINRRVSGESILSSYFLLCTLGSIAYKFYEYVGNPRPSVIRCLFLYNNVTDRKIKVWWWWCCWSKGQSVDDDIADRKVKVLMLMLLIERSKCWYWCCWSKGQSVDVDVVDRKVKVLMLMLLIERSKCWCWCF